MARRGEGTVLRRGGAGGALGAGGNEAVVIGDLGGEAGDVGGDVGRGWRSGFPSRGRLRRRRICGLRIRLRSTYSNWHSVTSLPPWAVSGSTWPLRVAVVGVAAVIGRG